MIRYNRNKKQNKVIVTVKSVYLFGVSMCIFDITHIIYAIQSSVNVRVFTWRHEPKRQEIEDLQSGLMRFHCSWSQPNE